MAKKKKASAKSSTTMKSVHHDEVSHVTVPASYFNQVHEASSVCYSRIASLYRP